MIYYGTIFLGFMIVFLSQINININYSKYKKIKVSKNITGAEVARMILDANGLNNIYVVSVNGELSDHYDPERKVIKLSKDIYENNTIASLGVAAHEVGHAIQDKEGYTFMRIRSFLVPFVNLISYLGYFGLVISLFAGITGYLKISLIVILATILFQLVTLPVEFDASKRAKEQLVKLKLIDEEEEEGVNDILKSAALTYVASLLSNLLQLFRIALLLGNDRD